MQVCRSSLSTRLAQISAPGRWLSKRQPSAQQLAFCAAQGLGGKNLVPLPWNLIGASFPRGDRAPLDSGSAHSPIHTRGWGPTREPEGPDTHAIPPAKGGSVGDACSPAPAEVGRSELNWLKGRLPCGSERGSDWPQATQQVRNRVGLYDPSLRIPEYPPAARLPTPRPNLNN